MTMTFLNVSQWFTLILLRTLIGWHFLYEGLYKLLLPGWTRAGEPVRNWSAAGYLAGTGGPFAEWFHALAQPPAIGWIDMLVPMALVAVGVSLMLGLFTQLGCLGAALFLGLFYVSAPPLAGVPQPGAEGAYLVVNKNLIELAAVLTVAAFRTGRLAGVDVWLRGRRAARDASAAAVEGTAL